MKNECDTSKIAIALSITSNVLIVLSITASLVMIGNNLVVEGIGVAIGSFVTYLILQSLSVITEACQKYIDNH